MPINSVIVYLYLLFTVSAIQAEDFKMVNYLEESGIEFYLETGKTEIFAGDRIQYTFGIYNNSGLRIEWSHGEDRPYDLLLTSAETGELVWRSSTGKWFSTRDVTDIIEPGENWEKSASENFYNRSKKTPIMPGRYIFKVLVYNLHDYEWKNPPVEIEITILEKQVEKQR